MAYKRKNGGKKYKRAKKKKMEKAVICYCPTVCPDVMSVSLSYNAQKQALGSGVVSILDFVFRGNSCFDPDFATGGQQPLGFDEWSSFYRRYRVKGAKIRVHYMNNAAVTAVGYIVANNTSAAFIQRANTMELPYMQSANLGQDAGNNQGDLTMYKSTAQVRGGPQDIVQYEQDLSALNTSNPNQEWFFHVGAYGIGPSVNNFDVDMDILVTYYVEFYDRETLARS